MKMVNRCAVLNCNNNLTNCEFSFFRFPKDVSRARTWVIACHRGDLIDKVEYLHNTSYRLCAMHFDKSMFSNATCNRIRKDAIPSIFSFEEGSSSKNVEELTEFGPIAGTVEMETPPMKLDSLSASQIKLEPSVEPEKNVDEVAEFGPICEAGTVEIETPPVKIDLPVSQIKVLILKKEETKKTLLPQAHRQTQTHSYLLSHTPKIIKMKTAFKKLQKENYNLKQKLKRLEMQSNSESSLENHTCNDKRPSRSKRGIKSTTNKEFFAELLSDLSDSEESTIIDDCTLKHYCRLCFNPSDRDMMTPLGISCSTNKLESDELKKIIKSCIPFFDVLVPDALLCHPCVMNLKKYYKFRVKCLQNQQIIENYIKSNGSTQQTHSLNRIIQEEFTKINTMESQTECKVSESDLLKTVNNSQNPQTLQVQSNTENNEFTSTNKNGNPSQSFTPKRFEESQSSNYIGKKQKLDTDIHNFDRGNFFSIKVEPKEEIAATYEMDYPEYVDIHEERIKMDTSVKTELNDET